ncbi:uncharacterized protein [Halyomorpha halys]|uniref:uncharacterized protein n=1 Tax=Halyomorpha halys TaxID=286706 RepID=UPI000D0C840C|nr:uncharacterized protein LOC112210814 [Halyomorpha halys]
MEKLFLLEVLVENVEIDYTKVNVDKKVLEAAKQLCIKIQFLSFPELTICEEDFCAVVDGNYQKNNINIKSGKSCLFSIRRWNVEDRSMPLNVTVLRTNPTPPNITVGRACINLGTSFTNILAAAQSTEYTETITKKCTDVYVLTNDSGADIGKIRMFVRLTCFGPLIVTQFQISGDENNSFLFRGNDGSGIVTFNRNISGELSEKPQPVHIPTKQIPCGEFQPNKYPQNNNRPANCPPCPPCPPYPQEWNSSGVPGQGMTTGRGHEGMPPGGHGGMPQSGQGVMHQGEHGVMPQSGHGGMPQSGHGGMPQSGHGGMPQSGHGGMPQGGHGGMPQGGHGGMGQGGHGGMGQGGMPQGGPGGMPQGGHGGMPQGGHGGMPQSGPGGMPQSGHGGMPQSGFGGMPQGGHEGMPQSGQGMMPWGEQRMPPGGNMAMAAMGSVMTPWGEPMRMQDRGMPVTVMTAGGQGMMPETGFMMMPGEGQGMMPGVGQGMMPGGGMGMMPGGGMGMMPGGGMGMMSGGGMGMMPGGGQGMAPGGGQGMMPGAGQGMMPGGGMGMMPGGGQGMAPGGGQGMMPGGEQNDLDYKQFGAEVNGHSLSIKVLRKPRQPKKVTPPLPICGHIPIGKKSSSSSSEEEVPPSLPPLQFCECDFPLPPGFSKTGYNQRTSSMKKKKKRKDKDNYLKCPLECAGGDPFTPSYKGYQMLNYGKSLDNTDKMKIAQPVNKHIGMLGDAQANQKAGLKPLDEQVHTSGNPTFILNIPPKVYPVQEEQFETPFQSEKAKSKSKKVIESGTQYNEKDGVAPEKLPVDGKDKKGPKKDGKGSKKKKGKKPKKKK